MTSASWYDGAMTGTRQMPDTVGRRRSGSDTGVKEDFLPQTRRWTKAVGLQDSAGVRPRKAKTAMGFWRDTDRRRRPWIGETVTSGGTTTQTRYVYDQATRSSCSFRRRALGTLLPRTCRTVTSGGRRWTNCSQEQLTPVTGGGYDLTSPGATVWTLTDNENTVRDLATYNATTGVTSVVNHREFSAYGELLSQTKPQTGQAAAVDCVFAYTGRALDEATGLQNNDGGLVRGDHGAVAKAGPDWVGAGSTCMSMLATRRSTGPIRVATLGIGGGRSALRRPQHRRRQMYQHQRRPHAATTPTNPNSGGVTESWGPWWPGNWEGGRWQGWPPNCRKAPRPPRTHKQQMLAERWGRATMVSSGGTQWPGLGVFQGREDSRSPNSATTADLPGPRSLGTATATKTVSVKGTYGLSIQDIARHVRVARWAERGRRERAGAHPVSQDVVGAVDAERGTVIARSRLVARDTVGSALGVVALFAIAFWQRALPAGQVPIGDALDRGALLQADENKGSGLFGKDIIPDPLGAVGYDTRGNAYLQKGDLDKAVADFTQAIRLIGIAAPQAAATEYCNRGIAYRRKGDLNRAILDHTQAIRLNPSDDEAFF